METKKSEKASLESRRASMFVLGMIISVALILESFEWVSGDYFKRDYITSGFEELSDEVIVEVNLAQPKQKQVVKTSTNSDIVQIVKDEAKIVEKKIDVTKKEEELVDITDIDLILDGDGGDGEPVIEDLSGIFDMSQIDKSPEFPGGMEKMIPYLRNNTKYPTISLEEGSQGKVYVSFVVDKEGNITDVQIAKSDADKYCGKEALRVVSSMPKWIPGEVRGRKVKTRFILPVIFRINS